MSLEELKLEALSDPETKKAYDDLEQEFRLIRTLLAIREQSGLTQSEVAEKMGTQKQNVSRIESGKSNPSIKSLNNYAKACGCKLTFGYESNV